MEYLVVCGQDLLVFLRRLVFHEDLHYSAASGQISAVKIPTSNLCPQTLKWYSGTQLPHVGRFEKISQMQRKACHQAEGSLYQKYIPHFLLHRESTLPMG